MASQDIAMPRLTVAIPLFHAAQWIDTITENVRRVPGNALILLSDETHSDETASLVADQFRDDPRIRLRICNGSPGWREHCNKLISECGTDFFSILPQDDLIAPGYYEKLIAALDQNPRAGIAFGTLYFEGETFPIPAQQPSLPFQTGLSDPWMEAVDLEMQWNLGIPFRGVIRRSSLRSIPATPGDRFADKVWMFGMALSSYLIEVPDASYFKRIHTQNTCTRWQDFLLEDWRALLIAETVSALGTGDPATRAIDLINQRFQETVRNLLRKWRSLGIC